MVFETDLLLLQSVIRTPASTDVDILVRQATRSTMRETLKEIDKRGFANIFVHLSVDDTYYLLRAVSFAIKSVNSLQLTSRIWIRSMNGLFFTSPYEGLTARKTILQASAVLTVRCWFRPSLSLGVLSEWGDYIVTSVGLLDRSCYSSISSCKFEITRYRSSSTRHSSIYIKFKFYSEVNVTVL